VAVGFSTFLSYLYPGWGLVLTQAVGDLGSLTLGQEELKCPSDTSNRWMSSPMPPGGGYSSPPVFSLLLEITEFLLENSRMYSVKRKKEKGRRKPDCGSGLQSNK